MRKRKLLVAMAGLAVVDAAGAVVLRPRGMTPGLTQENFDQVIDGGRRFIASERAVPMKEAQQILEAESERRGLDLHELSQMILG